jgi:hypothetical protein
MTKTRPRTGEKRRTQQPLKIDRLPIEVRDAVQYLKNVEGKTWQEIEELSSLPYNENWKTKRGGFVNWDALPTSTLELFPELRLPHSNLHRWYDLRVSQVVEEVQKRAVIARELAESFAKSIVAGDDTAVLNAARDQLMSVLAEDSSPKARISATKGLIALAETMQQARANTIRERKVATDERKIKVLEDREALTRRKLEAEAAKATKKLERGQLKPQDLAALVQRTFGIAPEAPHA